MCLFQTLGQPTVKAKKKRRREVPAPLPSADETSDDSANAATVATGEVPEPLVCCICYGEVFSCCPDCLQALCFEHREDASQHECIDLSGI